MEVSVVYCFDNNFTRPAYITIASLKHHIRRPATYSIYCIIAEDVTDQSKNMIHSLNDESFQIIFIAANSDFDNAYSYRGVTVASYYRLTLADLLPETVEKVLYIDVDTLVNDDISQLYMTDLQDNILGGVRNLYIFQVHEKLLSQLDYWEKSFGDFKSDYINAGVLLMNLKEIRKHGLAKKWLEYRNEKWEFFDQDILNISCKGKIKYLAPKYNATYAVRASGAESYGLFSKAELSETPVIFHFTAAKPWNAKYMSQAKVWWDFVKNNTTMYDYFLTEYKKKYTLKRKVNRYLRRIKSGLRNRLRYQIFVKPRTWLSTNTL